MFLTHLHKTLILSLTCLTLWAGSSAVVHAAEHGHEPHEHDGVACMLYSIQEHTAAIIPNIAPIERPITQIIAPDYIPYISTHVTNIQNRGPPPRGPPA